MKPAFFLPPSGPSHRPCLNGPSNAKPLNCIDPADQFHGAKQARTRTPPHHLMLSRRFAVFIPLLCIGMNMDAGETVVRARVSGLDGRPRPGVEVHLWSRDRSNDAAADCKFTTDSDGVIEARFTSPGNDIEAINRDPKTLNADGPFRFWVEAGEQDAGGISREFDQAWILSGESARETLGIQTRKGCSIRVIKESWPDEPPVDRDVFEPCAFPPGEYQFDVSPNAKE